MCLPLSVCCSPVLLKLTAYFFLLRVVAVHSQTGHKVALKIIGRSKLAHSDMIGRVNREIQYLKMLRHPHIIKLYEVITTPTDIIMAIEYAGGELFNYIVERGRMGEKDARRFFQQIVSAVEYCHRRNIVHRDLKPENVLLDPYDNVKVADFGLSNIMKDGEFLQTSCGSPNYAAPEVINGKLYAGPEVDAWSCGVILYVMLCGRLPFDDDHIPALFKKITSGVFTMPGYLSQGARGILSGLLQVDPLKRMTLAQVRQHPWFTTDLPEYLKPLPESTDIEGLAKLDESIISELERQLEMDRVSLVSQLRQRGTNPAKVAYQLTLDNRHMLEQSRNSNKQGIRNFALASSPPTSFQVGGKQDVRDRMGSMTTPSSSPRNNHLLAGHNTSGSVSGEDEHVQNHVQSNISILSSSLPRSPGYTLESQMYKMRLRGPHGQHPPATSSPLSQGANNPKPEQHQHQQHQNQHQQQQQQQNNQTAHNLAQQALGVNSSANSSPSRTHSNYFRASLPPLAGTATPTSSVAATAGSGNASASHSNSSSISSLAHASAKATATSAAGVNPYSHRNSEQAIPGSEHSGSTPQSQRAHGNSPLSRQNDPSAAENSDNSNNGVNRKPTVMRKRAKITRTRWHFGIRSRSPPGDVMAEVYRALRQLDMTWKHFNPYHLRAKYVDAANPTADPVKIDLQLYKLSQRDSYLVDFKAVIPPPSRMPNELTVSTTMGGDDKDGATTYRAGENTLISPMPAFIRAARRRMSAAVPIATTSTSLLSPSAAFGGHDEQASAAAAEPKSLDDQFLDSKYPIQIPAEVPDSISSPLAADADKSDMLPAPDTLPAKTMQRRIGGGGDKFSPSDSQDKMEVVESDVSMASAMAVEGGMDIPGAASNSTTAMAMDIPRPSHKDKRDSNPQLSTSMQYMGGGGTPRSQGKAPGSYMPGSVVGRVSLARTDVSLTADGVGAGNGSNRMAQERVVNIFPFFDVCCKLIRELAVPATTAT